MNLEFVGHHLIGGLKMSYACRIFSLYFASHAPNSSRLANISQMLLTSSRSRSFHLAAITFGSPSFLFFPLFCWADFPCILFDQFWQAVLRATYLFCLWATATAFGWASCANWCFYWTIRALFRSKLFVSFERRSTMCSKRWRLYPGTFSASRRTLSCLFPSPPCRRTPNWCFLRGSQDFT